MQLEVFYLLSSFSFTAYINTHIVTPFLHIQVENRAQLRSVAAYLEGRSS